MHLDRRLTISDNVTHKQVGDDHVFVVPETGAWIVTNDVGALLLLCLCGGDTPNEAILTVTRATGHKAETVMICLSSLLSELQSQCMLDNMRLDLIQQERVLHLYLTRRCNCRCAYCYMDAGSGTIELERKAIAEIIESFLSIESGRRVHFSGGEPLLRTDTLPLGYHARSLGGETVLFTNGILIQQDRAAELVDAFSRIQVTLDGASAKIHDSSRGSGSFDASIAGIQSLDAAGGIVVVAVNVFQQNLYDLHENLMPLLSIFWSGRHRLALNVELFPFGRATNLEFWGQRSREFAEGSAQLFQRLVEEGYICQDTEPLEIHKTCGIGKTLVVDTDGTLYPCILPGYSIGRFPEMSIKDALETLDILRESTSVDKIDECRTCDLRYLCLGGCRMQNFTERGDLLATGCDAHEIERRYRTIVDTWRRPLRI